MTKQNILVCMLGLLSATVLQGISHTYRRDLEAFLYVLLWLCARRGWALPGASKKPGAKNALAH